MVAVRRELPHERPVVGPPAPPRPRTRRRITAAAAPRAGFVAVVLAALAVLTALVRSWMLWIAVARPHPAGPPPTPTVRDR
ncbi:MAG TPA: hypothetical protein VH092_26105 [Urbifossiella sp.]|nr:hypothetical protein [Urbifossiella sp.]